MNELYIQAGGDTPGRADYQPSEGCFNGLGVHYLQRQDCCWFQQVEVNRSQNSLPRYGLAALSAFMSGGRREEREVKCEIRLGIEGGKLVEGKK